MASSLIGKLILKRYQVEDLIDSGGSGTVYRVRDLKRNTPLAMKVLNIDLADDPEGFTRFEREANALRTLIHPNIVPFYGMYQWDDFAFILQLYIDGPTLKGIQKKWPEQPLPVTETLVVMKALCAALGFAHSYKVVHCDVKPGNVLIDQGGQIYLMDFGIARHAGSTKTQYGVAGTPAYMAPEQARGDPVSAATDIYALGVLLFELSTGQRPFTGRTVTDASLDQSERIRREQKSAPPPDPRKLNPNLPADVVAVMLKALAKQPQDRYQSTRDFFEALCRAYQKNIDEIPDRLPLVGGPQPGEPRPDENPTPGPQGAPPVKKKTAGMWLAGGLVLVAAVVVGLIAWQRPAATPEPRNPPPVVQVVTASPIPAIGSVIPAATDVPPQPTATGVVIPTPTEIIPISEQYEVKTDTNRVDGQMRVFVPAGPFWRGVDQDLIKLLVQYSDGVLAEKSFTDATPLKRIQLSVYWIGKYEVTNRLYRACVEEKACGKPKVNSARQRSTYYDSPLYDDYPVVNITWQDALNYCRWAGGNLPTEAQWEKAARGVDQRIYPWGNQKIDSHYANVNQSAGGTTAVGSYPDGASPYRAMDMAGNVYEWVFDWYGMETYSSPTTTDPFGPAMGKKRVIRGGGEFYHPAYASSVFRDVPDDAGYGNQVGFRCAWEE